MSEDQSQDPMISKKVCFIIYIYIYISRPQNSSIKSHCNDSKYT